MRLVKEFKEFALRGNVVDLAVGIIIGGAFGKVVTSSVSDILMPPIGALTGGLDFKDFKLPLKHAADGAVAVSLNYGAFFNTLIDFTIVAFALFLVIKAMNTLRRKEAVAPTTTPVPSNTEVLLTEIRDLLKKK